MRNYETPTARRRRELRAFVGLLLLILAALTVLILLSACAGGEVAGTPSPAPATSAPAAAAQPDAEETAATQACRQFVEDEITPVDPVTYDGLAAVSHGVGVYVVSGAANTGGDRVYFTCTTALSNNDWRLVSMRIT